MSNPTCKTDDLNDSLDDLLGGSTLSAPAPRALPQDDQLARIRETGVGLEPAGKLFKVPCQKCKGRGRFIAYTGRDLGPCYTCKGKGHFERKTSPVKLAQAKVAREERKVRSAQENWDAFVAAHPEKAAVLTKGIAQTWGDGKWNDICRDIKGKVEKYGDLHQGTLDMLARSAARDAEREERRAQERAARVSNAATIDASKIAEAFRRGAEAGIKRLVLRFNGLRIVEAKKYPGTLYVTSSLRTDRDGKFAYLGKITDGKFIASRDCTPEEQAKVILVASDPANAAKVYGLETGECCVCGRELTNKESVETGIGPICSGRLGWTPGGIVKRAGEDF